MATERTISSLRRSKRASAAIRAGRAWGAALLLVTAAIHLVLWFEGYRDTALIGPAFLANAAGGVVLAGAMVSVSRRGLPAVAFLAGLFLVGTLAALLLSVTVGLFGFIDSLDAPLAVTSLVVEALGALACAATAVLAARYRPPRLRRDTGRRMWLPEPP